MINDVFCILSEGLQLLEGESRPLVARRNLWVTDGRNSSQSSPLVLRVVRGPGHGHLSLSRFTMQQLEAGAVVYEHDDSESHSDNVVLRAVSGEHTVSWHGVG